jgi:hypothetical protein
MKGSDSLGDKGGDGEMTLKLVLEANFWKWETLFLICVE